MLSERRLSEIRKGLDKASPGPWTWAYAEGEEPVDDPELLAAGINTLPTAPFNIQLLANGNHRFWIELTDTKLTDDVVFDLDFVKDAREWVPELLAEVDRLRLLLKKGDESR